MPPQIYTIICYSVLRSTLPPLIIKSIYDEYLDIIKKQYLEIADLPQFDLIEFEIPKQN